MALISFGIGLAFLAIIILLVFALGSVGLYFVSKFLNLKKQDFQTAFGVSMLSYLITVFIVFLNNTLQLDFLPFSGLVLGIFISLGFIKYVYNISWVTAMITWFLAGILQLGIYLMLLVMGVILGMAVLI